MKNSYLFLIFIVWFILPAPLCQWIVPNIEASSIEKTSKNKLTVTENSYISLMNRGKAHIENLDANKAIAVYEKARQLRKGSSETLRNLARALRLASKTERALEVLLQAKKLDLESAATSYLLGIVYTDIGDDKMALSEFENAVRLDPFTDALRYQLAIVYERTGQHDNARTQLYETVRLNPFHVNAHYKLSQYARKRKDKAETMRLVLEVKRLLKLSGNSYKGDLNNLEKCIYTTPELPSVKLGKTVIRSPEIAVSFQNDTDIVFSDEIKMDTLLATILEQGDSGLYTIFTVGEDGSLCLMKMSKQGYFITSPLSLELPSANGLSVVIAGNFYDHVPPGNVYDARIHSLNDLFLIGPERAFLLLRTGKSSFKDITNTSGLGNVKGRHAQWVDYDHDGDLDLLIAGMERLELWQNNGNSTFIDVTDEVGIPSEISPAMVGVADLDSNNATDLVVTQWKGETLVMENQRVGKFRLMPRPPAPWPPALGIGIEDLNNDGHPDSVLMTDHQITILFGQTSYRKHIPFSMFRPRGFVAVDYDNDGFQDILVFGQKSNKMEQGYMLLLRNTGGRTGWMETTNKTGLRQITLPPIVDVIVADLDNDHDSDLFVMTDDHQIHFLRNVGGHINGQLQVRLQGTKSNTGGIGTRVEIRDEEFLATRTVSRVPVEIGLGGRKRLDVIQVLWSNGVVDNQVDQELTLNLPTSIKEPHVDTGSCPFLYAWDGEGFRFVTDLLGNAPVGLPLSRNSLLPADIDEFVVIGNNNSFKPDNGFYKLEVTSEFNETVYLDSTKLIVIDHYPSVEIYSTDKIRPGPFSASELWALNSKISIVDASIGDGRNYKTELLKIDGRFTSPGVLLPPPYRGMCYPMTLTLDFGKIDISGPLVLALTGWLQYGQASTNIALSQNNSLSVIPPMLEVERGDGSWKKLDIVVGMPAGKTKTILVDLKGKLPIDTKRLRLTTTFEIRWDRIALFQRTKLPEVSKLLPVRADLRWRGFSKIKSRKHGHPKTPAYTKVSQRPPWRVSLQGWCTDYGNVIELIDDVDDVLVVMNGGDALNLRFEAGVTGPVPQGKVRTFFFYTVGWNKDGDYNVSEGHSVYPVANPVTNQIGDSRNDWQLKYNNRWLKFDRFSQDSP